MKFPIRHKKCGTIVAWYIGDKDKNEARSNDVELLDGTKPGYCSEIKIPCDTCSSDITKITELERCFDE